MHESKVSRVANTVKPEGIPTMSDPSYLQGSRIDVVESLNLLGSKCQEYIGAVFRGNHHFSHYKNFLVSSTTKIGTRPTQEDRCIVIPRIGTAKDCSFFGVFDGTVGDVASDFVHKYFPVVMFSDQRFAEIAAKASQDPQGFSSAQIKENIAKFMHDSFIAMDTMLIRHCHSTQNHYTSSTAASVLLTGNLATIAHLGDSRVVVGRRTHEYFVTPTFTTQDHKPDNKLEHVRIDHSGGSVVYLHGGKPYLRGGDFVERQGRGEQAMQLNYSRAFGGKDLKMFGLSSDPEIHQIEITPGDNIIILGTDGLWDVINANNAVKIAYDAIVRGKDPSLVLTDFALEHHRIQKSGDNVTVVVIAILQ